MQDFFVFKGQLYREGAIVQLHEECQEQFGFNTYLVFDKYEPENGIYRFHTLYDTWKQYNIPVTELKNVIENATPSYIDIKNKQYGKVQEKYIEGIVSAWIWYILIMFFALFAKDPGSKILTWIVASVIFFSWRRRKLNGE